MKRDTTEEKLGGRILNVKEIRHRYEQERLKRIRFDGINQYGGVEKILKKGRQRHESMEKREPIQKKTIFTFIGGGFSSLITCSKLKSSGITDMIIIEKGRDFGGAWYWNRYPGAQCDTASMVYLPFLEETNYIPSERYAHGPEIFAHCQRIGKSFDLYQDTLFDTTATTIRWDDKGREWIIETDQRDVIRCRFVGVGMGQLHVPKIPKISGFDVFHGHMFHSSMWDYEYTGGNSYGEPMNRLFDKHVGVIGTGPTAVQCIPSLAKSSKRLFVFQRTPSSVDIRKNEGIDEAWYKQVIGLGWQSRWMWNFVECRERLDNVEDLVKDGWTAFAERVRDKLKLLPQDKRTPEVVRAVREECDMENMERVRARVDEEVHDRGTAEKLKAWYHQFCKRPCFHDDYLQTFNRKNTYLIDTNGKGITSLSRNGVVTGDVEYQVDCLIFATGFRTDPRRVLPDQIEIVGRDGIELSKFWKKGMKSLYGIFVNGFPNFFIIQPTQGANFLSNIPHNLIDSADTITAVIQHVLTTNFSGFESGREAQQLWVERLLSRSLSDQWNIPLRECVPGTFNNEGNPDDDAARLMVGNPDGPLAHFEMMRRWRESGEFEGIDFF